MLSNQFKVSNPTPLSNFIAATLEEQWDYCQALRLSSRQLETVSFEQMVANLDDMADGVTKVKLCFSQLFFNLFDHLVIKHHGDYEHRMMFYTHTTNAGKVLTVYKELQNNLGGGTLMDHKFSSFNDEQKVISLSKGKFDDARDDIVHHWNYGKFYFVLDYKTHPLRQLVLTVGRLAQKTIDFSQRTKGTLINLLKYDIRDILSQQEIAVKTTFENEEIKFIDYTFKLDPPELGIFEFSKVKIFHTEKLINEQTQVHVTYYSKYEVDTAATIRFCDSLVAIYGSDNYGDAELKAHELEFLDDSDYWTGRSWMFNTDHAIQDLKDDNQTTLYQVSITADPKQDGLSLHVLSCNKMFDFHHLMHPNNKM